MIKRIKYGFKKSHGIGRSYFLIVGLFSIFFLVAGFSFALFTAEVERRGTLNIITGNLYSFLESEKLDTSNSIEIEPGEQEVITISIKNSNPIDVRFNLWYVSSDRLNIGYTDEKNTPPVKEGEVLKVDASKTYQIVIENFGDTKEKITFGSEVGLPNKDLVDSENGFVIEPYEVLMYQKLFHINSLGDKGSLNTSDPEQTFITGEEPNNYVWYSGKLWRAVSLDPADQSVKLVTEWNVSEANFNFFDTSRTCTDFSGSYIEKWLNDTTVDGFLGNLREPEKFIKMDSKWNATRTVETTKPAKTTIVTDAVGLLNIYEYTKSYEGTTAQLGYLNNGLNWWQLTPSSAVTQTRPIFEDGSSPVDSRSVGNFFGIRPSINMKSNVSIVGGDGTVDHPYRLSGDTDTSLEGTLLSKRYSGEYIRFGVGVNNLYRIVSHELGGTKIVSAEVLKDERGALLTKPFSNNANYKTFDPTNSDYTLAYFLNHDYLDPVNGYLTADEVSMIENATWYLGTFDSGLNSYWITKYATETGTTLTTKTVNAKVGLLRLGEQMAGSWQRFIGKDGAVISSNVSDWWLLTERKDVPYVMFSTRRGYAYMYSDTTVNTIGVRPSVHLKQNIKITSGDGTKDNPFTISQ